jgi:hypothetical protein
MMVITLEDFEEYEASAARIDPASRTGLMNGLQEKVFHGKGHICEDNI